MTKRLTLPDWLRRDPPQPPLVRLADRSLPLDVRRLDRARRMTMRLAPDARSIRITMPPWGRTADALAFAESRRGWLEGQLAGHTAPALPAPAPDGLVPFRGDLLRIAHDPGAPRAPALADGTIRLGGPDHTLGPRLRRWLERQALDSTGADLAHYCAMLGRPAPRHALSRAQRRWGSCAGDGTIRINWRLIMAPDFVRRSVVAHEVAHLAHFDHSPRFHALLATLFEGDMAEANRWLKQEGRGLYRWFG